MDATQAGNQQSNSQGQRFKKRVAYAAIGLCAPAVCLLASNALAMDWNARFGLGSAYTSNSLQTANDEQKDYAAQSQLGFDLVQKSTSFDLGANYDVGWTTWQDDTQSDELAVNGQAAAHWFIIPSLLTWDFNQQNSRQKMQSARVDTSDTRANQSVFSTGPSSILRLSSRDHLKLSADAMRVSTSGKETNDYDSDRQLYSAALVHSTSAIQTLGVQVSQQRAEYDVAGVPDTVFSQAALEWNRQYRLGRLQASLGKNRSKRESGAVHNGNYYQFFVDYNGVGHVVSLAGMRTQTDSMLGLYSPGFATPLQPGSGANDSFSPNGTVSETIDVVDEQQIDFNYSTVRVCERCNFSVRASYSDQDYLVELLDKRTASLQTGLEYLFSERWKTQVTLSGGRERYPDINDRTDDYRNLNIALSYQTTPELLLTAQTGYTERDSDDPLFDYNEATALFGFVYQFGNTKKAPVSGAAEPR
ncbi:hypothetical protein HDN1F_05470 [gamma proteobacterium HdN1]|nr:hypothetical protein HDN1F_05470 [gamma proteobacterium HdN1]